MLSIRSILNLLALGSVVVDKPISERLVKKIVYTLGLVVLACMLVGALLFAAVFYGYHYMIEEGYDPMQSVLYVLGGLALVGVGVITVALNSVYQLINEVKGSMRQSVPLPTHLLTEATNVIEGFFKGFSKSNPSNDYKDKFYR